MKIQEFYYFHSRVSPRVPKNLINNLPRKSEHKNGAQEFACYEVAL